MITKYAWVPAPKKPLPIQDNEFNWDEVPPTDKWVEDADLLEELAKEKREEGNKPNNA